MNTLNSPVKHLAMNAKMNFLKAMAITLPLSLIFYGCFNTTKENDLTKDNLRGKVKSYTESSYEAVELFGNIEKGEWEQSSRQRIFDKKGLLIEENSYNPDGSIDKRRMYKHDENGNLIEDISYNSNEEPIIKTVFIYDESGNLVEKNGYGYFLSIDGTLAHQWTYKYDEKGNQIEVLNVFEKSRWTYKYDEKGNVLEYNMHKANGSLGIKEKSKYDKMGNKIENNVYSSDGSLRSKYSYKYDKRGNEIEESVYHSDGSLKEKETYKYDEKGNVIEESWYNSNDILVANWKYQYDFDKKGNWIKRISFEDGKPTDIREREYEYYE